MTAAAPRPGRARRICKVLLLVLIALATIPVALAMALATQPEGRR